MKGRPFEVRHCSSTFIDLMRNQNFSTFPSSIFPLCHGPNQKNKHGYKYMCQSCMHDGSRPSSMSQTIYCQTLPTFSCVLTAFCISSSREISQTVRTLGPHIYSRNVDIHRLWQHIPRFLMHFLDKNMLLTKHCKVCLHFKPSYAKPEDTQIVFYNH